MRKYKKIEDELIDPVLAEKILRALNDACNEAAEKVGEEMGFDIHKREFKFNTFPPIYKIIFDFQVEITR